MTGPQISAQPRTVYPFNARQVSGSTAGTYIVASLSSVGKPDSGLSGIAVSLFHVRPEEWGLYGRVLGYQLEARFLTTDNAPNVNAYLTVFPVVNLTGLTTGPTVVLGTEVPGARTPSRLFNTANAKLGPDSSGFFTLPADDIYAICFVQDATFAANGYIGMYGRLAALTR